MSIQVSELISRLKREIERIENLPNPGVKEVVHQARLREALRPVRQELVNAERIQAEYGSDFEF